MQQLSNANIGKLCRACFEICDEYKMLFEESETSDKLTLGDIFSQVVKIETKFCSENTPTRICVDCVKDLNIAYAFIQKSQKNNDNLLEFLKSGSIKQPDCLSEFPIDIPNESNTVDFPQVKVENELLNDYEETFSDIKISASEKSDSTDTDYDEPLSSYEEKKVNKMQCTYCDRIFKRQNFLENHKRKHEEELKKREDIEDCKVVVLCDECGFRCSSNTELKTHMTKEHKESESDDKRTTRSQQLKMKTRSQSKKLKTTSGRFECDSCFKTFAWKKDLYRHERYHEPNTKKFSCPHCDRRFIRKDKLSSHLQVHLTGLNKSHTIKSFQHFANHLYSEKKFKEIKCMICSLEGFTSVRGLRQHITLHNNLKLAEELTGSLVVERFFPNTELNDVQSALREEMEKNEFGKLHSIVNGHSYEMGISDSDDSDPECQNRYSCEICSESFSRKHKLMTHQAYEHSFEDCPYECRACKLRFTCKEIFESHRKHHCENSDRQYHCQQCPGRFTWLQNIENHKCRKKSSLNRGRNKCEICDKAFACPRDLRLHKKTHIPEGKSHVCVICGDKFYRYESLRYHINSHNSDDKSYKLKKIFCLLCNTELPNVSGIKTHLSIHADGHVDLEKCKFANIFYPEANEAEVAEAIKRRFEEQKLSQLYVGINKYGLEIALSDSDSGDELQSNCDSSKTFTCEVCHVKFPRMHSIFEHQVVEHDDVSINTSYTCDNCDDQFVCKELLQRHLAVGCLSSNRFTCTKCGCKFVFEQNLSAHVCLPNDKSSEDAKQCEICGKKFNWLKDLHRHKRSHVPDEKKFECLVCGRKFNRKDNMRAHLKVHNVDYKMRSKALLKWEQQDENMCRPHGEKIIQCKICHTIHNSIRDLNTHLMTHSDCNTLKQKDTEVKEISMILYNKPMDLRSLSKAICSDLSNNKHSRFYSITNEVGYELSLFDSETATDLEADEEEDSDTRKGYTCMLCSKKFNRKFKIFEHQRQEHSWSELPLECSLCSAKFVCEGIYDLHLKYECENAEKQYKCKQCPLKFVWKENLKNHEKFMHDKNLVFAKKHHCGTCDRSFLWHKDLLRHKKGHRMEEEKFECTWCFRIFMRRDNLKVHMKVHKNATHLLLPDIYYLARPNSTKVAECKYCNQKYTTAGDLLQHIRNVHLSFQQQQSVPDPSSYSITNALGYEMDIEDSETEREEPIEKYSCELCETRFNRRFKLLQHQQSLHYSDNIPHKCDYCNFKCVSEPVLAYHMRTQCMNSVKQFRCSKCTMRFMWRENLENHESVIHDSPRTHTCEVCKRDFATQHDLKNHNDCKPPDEVKLFECDMCDRKYNRKDRLMKHVKVHNEKNKEQRMKNVTSTDKKFLCAFCGKEVSSSSNLVIHMRRHTGEKPFKCEFCNKGFPRSSDLSCHRRTHTGEKPHKCTECDKAFSRSYKLQTHMRIHSGERPYKCTYCEKSFTQSNDLTLHVRRHTGERPYICETCGERFIQGTALRNHRRMRGHYAV